MEQTEVIDKYEVLSTKLGTRCETPYEDLFITLLLDSGVYVKLKNVEAQVKFFKGNIYKYRVDFLFTTHKGNEIVVEIDGKHHYEKSCIINRDKIREEELEKAGFKVMRLANSVIKECDIDEFREAFESIMEVL